MVSCRLRSLTSAILQQICVPTCHIFLAESLLTPWCSDIKKKIKTMFDVFQPFKQPPSLSNWSNPSYFQVVLRWTAAFAPAIPPSTPWGKWPATRAAWSTASGSRARNRRRCWLLRWAALLLACDTMGVPKLRLKNGAERWWACPL